MEAYAVIREFAPCRVRCAFPVLARSCVGLQVHNVFPGGPRVALYRALHVVPCCRVAGLVSTLRLRVAVVKQSPKKTDSPYLQRARELIYIRQQISRFPAVYLQDQITYPIQPHAKQEVSVQCARTLCLSLRQESRTQWGESRFRSFVIRPLT